MTIWHWLIVIFPVGTILLMAVASSYEAGRNQGRRDYRSECPHEFCKYQLKTPGTTDGKGNYVIEDCPGCSRLVQWTDRHRYDGGSLYRRVAEGKS